MYHKRVTKKQIDRRFALLKDGVVFNNCRSIVFMLNGNMYTTNQARKKPYSMDDSGWRILSRNRLWCYWQVLTRQVKRL